jgi:hypothetical protein
MIESKIKNEIQWEIKIRRGKNPIRLFHYDENFKFIKKYESCNEFRKEYFPNDIGTRPLFPKGSKRTKYKYQKLPDGTYISTYRIGREKIIHLERIINSPFCFTKSTNSKMIGIYNLLDEEIAVVKDIHIASLLTGKLTSSIYLSLNNENRIQCHEIYFKYK